MAKKQKRIEVVPAFQRNAESFSVLTEKLSTWMAEWVEILGLERWSFNVEYHPTINPEQPRAGAQVVCSFEYQNADIDFWLVNLNGCNDKSLEATVVHELVHLIVKPLKGSDSLIFDEEWVVTSVTKSLLRAKYDNYKK